MNCIVKLLSQPWITKLLDGLLQCMVLEISVRYRILAYKASDPTLQDFDF